MQRKKHDKRDLARIMFVTSDMTAKQIAEAIDVNEKTVGLWRTQDNWDEERTLRNVSPLAIIKQFNEEIEWILKKGKEENKKGDRKGLTPVDADMISKLTRGIKNMRNSVDPQTKMEVLNSFISWLSQADLELAKQLSGKAILYVQVALKESKNKD